MPPSAKPTAATSVSSAGAARPAQLPSQPSEKNCTTLLMDIDSYAEAKKLPNGTCIKSPKLDAGGHSWHIVYYPNGLGPTATGAASLYLQRAAADDDGAVKVRYQFMMVEQGGATRFKSICLKSTIERRASYMYGVARFVTHEDLESSSSIKDGGPFQIRCDLTVLEPTDDQAPQPSLHADISRLLATKVGKDVDFEVGGKVFAAHRCVLAARSSVFRAELFGPEMEEKTGYIRVGDIIPEAFDAMLHFIYTDSLPEMPRKLHEIELMADHLLSAADRYDLTKLKSITEDKLCSHVGVATALRSLVLAEQHKCPKLKKVCLEFMSSSGNARGVMAADDVENLVKSCPSVARDLVVKILNTPRSQLSLTKIILYCVVFIGFLSVDSVGLLKLSSAILLMLLVFVCHHA